MFQHLRQKKYSIICLQDVHLENKMESYITSEWGFKVYLAGFKSNKRGVMILLNNNFEQEVYRVLKDPNGNYIILEIKIKDQMITLVNLYGPNEDRPIFYEDIKQKIKEFENDNVIICGDFNLVMDPDIDTENYKQVNNPKARIVVKDLLEELEYMDAWRILNEDKKGFTWKKLNPVRKQARLDYFLISWFMYIYHDDCKIVPGYRTDHSGLVLKLNFFEQERGKGYWKFNNSLLKDKKYIDIVHKTITEVLNLHLKDKEKQIDNVHNSSFTVTDSTVNPINKNNTNTNDKNNERFIINDQLLLETILMMIRGETIKYSSYKKKNNEKEEKQLENEIQLLEQSVMNNLNEASADDIKTSDDKRNLLVELRKVKIEGTILRSACRYEDLGEKPSSYFLKLENRNYTDKVMSKLIDENNEELTDTKDILDFQKQYYKNLYTDQIKVDDANIKDKIRDNKAKLSENDSKLLEGEITNQELSSALKNMNNSKNPGSDGFTAEFFKFFWKDLGIFILNSINYAYKNDSLSVTQKQGVITCLPKPNKNKHFLKNWRPISLLNVVYKMMSSVIANRLKSVLDKVISNDQKGFISGRFIGENIRLIYDILFESKQQNIPGLLVSIDFQQAFDSISWKFIDKTLDYLNFGPSFKKWIKLFQKGSESCILQNGYMSDYFTLQRGCRQGDPISPYIFILCVEVLGKMIKNDKEVRGIRINETEFKLSQYADDTQIFLDGSKESMEKLMSILQTFYRMSGLKVNEEKTKALWVGSMSKSHKQICPEYNLDWEQKPIKILGVTFTADVCNIWEHNA